MTTMLLSPPSSSYDLVEALREPGAIASVRRSPPDEWATEELLLRKLGAKGWVRVHHFRNYYQAGWGEGQASPLSPRALEAFLRFLSEFEFPKDRSKPSVFLTDQGGIELAWEDAAGAAVQVAFGREEAEFFRAATGDELVMPLNRLPEFSARVSASHVS